MIIAPPVVVNIAVFLWLFADKINRLSNVHEAVRFGDVTELQARVQSGAGINDTDSKFKFTPLHWACNYGSLEVLEHKLYIKRLISLIEG